MISVVIPLYNKEQSITATLQSVLAQTYTDYEVIIVDDGSTDNSLNVVREYISSLPSLQERAGVRPLIRLIHQENAGVSAARNAGILAAQGEYVAFLDADDLWTPDFLETLAALIRDYPDAGLYSLGYMVVGSQLPNNTELEAYNRDAYRGFEREPWSGDMDLNSGTSCSRKERLIRVGMFDTRITHGEDIDFWWRLIIDGGLARDKKCCAFYRMDAENRAMRRFPPINKSICYYVDKYNESRTTNAEFRCFYDKEMIYRLYPYLFIKQYAKDARRLARKLDYSQLKWSMHFRMMLPYTYRFLRKITRRNEI